MVQKVTVLLTKTEKLHSLSTYTSHHPDYPFTQLAAVVASSFSLCTVQMSSFGFEKQALHTVT